MNKAEALKSLATTGGFFRHWMGLQQRTALIYALQGEEGAYFCDLLTKLKARIETMPKTCETKAIDSKDKIIHLHYFRGSVDAWIVEKDMGDGSGDESQIQAFGRVNLDGTGFRNAEWGYVSISVLIDTGVALDLYWKSCAAKEIK